MLILKSAKGGGIFLLMLGNIPLRMVPKNLSFVKFYDNTQHRTSGVRYPSFCHPHGTPLYVNLLKLKSER